MESNDKIKHVKTIVTTVIRIVLPSVEKREIPAASKWVTRRTGLARLTKRPSTSLGLINYILLTSPHPCLDEAPTPSPRASCQQPSIPGDGCQFPRCVSVSRQYSTWLGSARLASHEETPNFSPPNPHLAALTLSLLFAPRFLLP